MKSKLLSLMLLLASISPAYAGSGNDHGHGHGHGYSSSLSSEQAIITASKTTKAIIEQNIEIEGSKLDASWGNVADSDKSISRKGDGYYIVSLKNEGKTLYMLMSEQGEFYDANFTGTFEGLEE